MVGLLEIGDLAPLLSIMAGLAFDDKLFDMIGLVFSCVYFTAIYLEFEEVGLEVVDFCCKAALALACSDVQPFVAVC